MVGAQPVVAAELPGSNQEGGMEEQCHGGEMVWAGAEGYNTTTLPLIQEHRNVITRNATNGRRLLDDLAMSDREAGAIRRS